MDGQAVYVELIMKEMGVDSTRKNLKISFMGYPPDVNRLDSSVLNVKPILSITSLLDGFTYKEKMRAFSMIINSYYMNFQR